MQAKVLVCLCVLVLLGVCSEAFPTSNEAPRNKDIRSNDFPFHGDDWQRRKAGDKQNLLWEYIMKDTSAADWYSTFALTELFLQSSNTTFDAVGDDMPKQLFGLETRKKLIHSVGPIARCKLVSNGKHNYTGLFKGASFGFIRFSTAQKPDRSAKYGFAPGIAVKLLRDGAPSANVMAMYSLEGQESFNFFAHDLTNHVPNIGPNAPLPLKMLSKKFETSSYWPNMIGLSDWGSIDERGQHVSQPNFPHRLIFHPTTKVHNLFPNETSQTLGEQLRGLPAGPVYEVWATSGVFTPLQQIGTLVLQDVPTSSYFGDRSLFFEHQRMEVDLLLRPDWIDPARDLFEQQSKVDHWTYPDLPW